MIDSAVITSDGRRLAYTDIGEQGWPCVFFFHGAPSSRLRLAYLEPAFRAAGVRAISADRPGYGDSSRQPGRSMADWPADVACLADALGVERFVVAGHSSGGPYALACAALLGDRVAACITLGGVTDMAWPPAWEGYPPFELEMMRAPDEATAMARCEALFGADGSGFLSASGLAFPAPDERLYTNAAIAPQLTASRVEAFRQGVVGYAQDLAIQGRPWPFHPEEIGCPVHILHGDGDTLLPLAHSVHNAELIPRGRLHLATGHGHFTILEELPALVMRNSSPGDGPVSA